MATLPAAVTQSPLVTAIYAWWENKPSRLSRRLGGSQIGRECERELWYSFRWCFAGGAKQFDGRMLRLFNRGHREEPVFSDELRGIGAEVIDVDPTTGEQFEFTACSGHFVVKIDGVALGLPEAPKTWHNLSYKTANAKNFARIAKDGVAKGEPKHYDQNQIEMRLAGLERTQYLIANKDTDDLYAERLRYDAAHAERLERKAERVIFAPEPLERISEDAAFWKCKGCAFTAVCHTAKLPTPNCRNCLHATPERDGNGRWTCARHGGGDIPLDMQAEGCQQHRYIPALLSRWGEAVDASEAEDWVEYRMPGGETFRNGPFGADSFASAELHNANPTVLVHPEFVRLRREHAARFTAGEFGEAA